MQTPLPFVRVILFQADSKTYSFLCRSMATKVDVFKAWSHHMLIHAAGVNS